MYKEVLSFTPNGGIFTEQDADRMIENTGADGIMLARGAIADPFLVNKLLAAQSLKTLKQYILEHVELMASCYGDDKASREFRKFTPYYFKGAVGVKQLKAKLVTANSTEEIFRLINQNL